MHGVSSPQIFTVWNCNANRCKTCSILITDNQGTSNLTKKHTIMTMDNDHLKCKSRDLFHWSECNICGLLYISLTKGELHTRMYQTLMEILFFHASSYHKKDHHCTANRILSKSLWKEKAYYWIRGTLYDCYYIINDL